MMPLSLCKSVYIFIFFFKSSSLDLCLSSMCHHKLLLWSAVSFAHNVSLFVLCLFLCLFLCFLGGNNVFLYGTSVICIICNVLGWE